MARKTRVLQVVGSLRVGGLETVALNFYRFCDKSKYSFDYLVYGDTIEPLEAVVEELGGRVFHIPYPHKGIAKYLHEMQKIMHVYGPYDVVHAHSLFNSGFVMKVAYEEGVPIRISHAHSDRRNTKTTFLRNTYNRIMRLFINRYSTQKFACSEGAGKYLYGTGYSENTYILKNGVDTAHFCFDLIKREKIKKEFGWENNNIIGHIGRLAEVKNQKKIIDVFANAYRKDQSLRLLIAGDGPLREVLQKQIDQYGLSKVAILTGTRNDAAALFSAFDVYLMPSLYEGVSLSLIEAQASGVHCIVSQNAAANETRLTDCINILEHTDSDDVWAEKVIQLVKRERISGTANTIIEKGYAVSEIVKKAMQFYGEEND